MSVMRAEHKAVKLKQVEERSLICNIKWMMIFSVM